MWDTVSNKQNPDPNFTVSINPQNTLKKKKIKLLNQKKTPNIFRHGISFINEGSLGDLQAKEHTASFHSVYQSSPEKKGSWCISTFQIQLLKS